MCYNKDNSPETEIDFSLCLSLSLLLFSYNLVCQCDLLTIYLARFFLLFAFRSIFDNSFSSLSSGQLFERRGTVNAVVDLGGSKDTDRLIRANEIFVELHKGVNERVRCLEIAAPIYPHNPGRNFKHETPSRQ